MGRTHIAKKPQKHLSASGCLLESLENRQLMSTAQINYTNFSSTSGLVLNGFDTPAVSNARLHMTTLVNDEGRSVWYGSKVPVKTFRTDFSFRNNASTQGADGFTFTIQPTSTSELGIPGRYLGYTNIPNSVAVAFNMFNYGTYGSKFGFAKYGQLPPDDTDMSPIDLHSHDQFRASVTYDGHMLRVNVIDANDRTKTFSAAKAIDLTGILGTSTAYVGFTASTGVHNSDQFINSWTYSGNNGPTITAAAAANPNPVTGTKTALSVKATDSNDPTLTYSWAAVSKPGGASTPRFSANNSTVANSVFATFYKDGTYTFRATATDDDGLSATSLVKVVVQQVATEIGVSVHKQVFTNTEKQQYSATVLDQFHHAMRVQPTTTFSILEGRGSINAATGLYTPASDYVGHLVIEATAGKLSGTVGATVLAAT